MTTPRGGGQRTPPGLASGPDGAHHCADPVHPAPPISARVRCPALRPDPHPDPADPGPSHPPAARRPPVPCGSAAAERGLQEPREGRRGRGPRRRFARSGNRQPSTSAPYCAAPPPGLQYGRWGGAKNLQPFPLPVPAPRPLAGQSSRRKGRKRRKHAIPRRRRRVLWLPARTAPLQRLLSPRN